MLVGALAGVSGADGPVYLMCSTRVSAGSGVPAGASIGGHEPTDWGIIGLAI
jgi:hypothetical protein